jgi:hypothetical protein
MVYHIESEAKEMITLVGLKKFGLLNSKAGDGAGAA